MKGNSKKPVKRARSPTIKYSITHSQYNLIGG